MSMENHGGMISTENAANLSTRALLKSYQVSSSSKAAEIGEGNEYCPRKHLSHISKGFLTFRIILRHGADGFTSPPKEDMLRIFVALKNPSIALDRV
jgi:hypothetical protein